MADRAPTARAIAREAVRGNILTAARARLTAEGPTQLSLRAVARDVGMVSSAVYRYFPSRDDLLTALLVQDYDELGAAVEDAEAVVDRADVGGRWIAACRAVRAWSVAHPGDFALLYGSPVPGYVAPPETVGPASRVVFVLVRIVVDTTNAQTAAGRPVPVTAPPAAPDGVAAIVAGAADFVRAQGLTDDAPAEVVLRTLMAWTTIIGTVSFELFGHLVGSVDDGAAYSDQVAVRLAADLGFDAVPTPPVSADTPRPAADPGGMR